MHYRLGNLTPRAERHALEMAALTFKTRLLLFLVFFFVPLPTYAEQQRITVKPEVEAF